MHKKETGSWREGSLRQGTAAHPRHSPSLSHPEKLHYRQNRTGTQTVSHLSLLFFFLGGGQGGGAAHSWDWKKTTLKNSLGRKRKMGMDGGLC